MNITDETKTLFKQARYYLILARRKEQEKEITDAIKDVARAGLYALVASLIKKDKRHKQYIELCEPDIPRTLSENFIHLRDMFLDVFVTSRELGLEWERQIQCFLEIPWVPYVVAKDNPEKREQVISVFNKHIFPWAEEIVGGLMLHNGYDLSE